MRIHQGTLLGGYYRVEDFLGEGGFGYVTKCRNTETNGLVAIKVNKTHPEIVRQARKEIAILKRLEGLDSDTGHIVAWNGFFFDKEHICLNFELLDQSVSDFLEDRGHRAVTVEELSPVVHQVATALLHLSTLRIIHADLKPDNIMIANRHQQPLRVKLIDFGLACLVSAVEPGICLQTIWYRAPEIILHIPFNEAIDMWSLGLIAAELATGYPLYPAESDYDVLNFILQTQGQPEDYILDRGRGTENYFHKQGNSEQKWTFKTPDELYKMTGEKSEDTRFYQVSSLDELEMIMDGGSQRNRCLLVDLIKKMLHLDSDLRIQPLEVLQHPFFNRSQSQCISFSDIGDDITGHQEAESEDSSSSCSLQSSGPRITFRQRKTTTYPCSTKVPALAENDPAEMEANDQQEENIQPNTNRNNNWFGCFIRYPFQCCHSYDTEDI